MNKTKIALKMAIEALLYGTNHTEAVKACKEALESQEQEYDINEMIDKITPENLQEPVCAVQDGEARWYYAVPENGTLLYTHPHQWQGLTELEQWNLINKSDIPADYDHELLAIARAIEQALKEKNHD